MLVYHKRSYYSQFTILPSLPLLSCIVYIALPLSDRLYITLPLLSCIVYITLSPSTLLVYCILHFLPLFSLYITLHPSTLPVYYPLLSIVYIALPPSTLLYSVDILPSLLLLSCIV